jgi:hypothetical protein
MKKYIILSVNDNPDYLFHVPLVCWAWEQLGWWPIVLYEGEFSAIPDYVFKFTFEEYDGSFVHALSPIHGYRSDTITQVSRLYGACIADGYIMTGDIDMLPLSDYWQPDYNKLTVWGRDLTDYHYPICYIGAPSETWREIMNIGTCEYNELIKRDLRQQKNMWVLDQDLITEKINNSGFIPFRKDRGTDKRTGYPIGRIDRSHWTLEHKEYIDCHMFHDVHRNEESFKKTLNMLHTVFPNEDFKWWVQYTKEFKKLCQKM